MQGQGQRKQKKVTQNPLLNQFKIIKQKLQQGGASIIQLKKQLQIERHAMLQTISQFQAHQKKIMTRLRRLEEINLKYIKQYAEIKKIAPPQQLLIHNNDKIQEVSMRDILLKKIEHYKEYYTQSTKHLAGNTPEAFQKTVSNVCGLLQQYLVQKQIDYHRTTEILYEQKKRKWKEAKGLEAYKASKQQQKVVDCLKIKIAKFKQTLPKVDQHNMVQIFNKRKQIQAQIYKLDPSRQEMTLEESAKQQGILKQIIQEIIMMNVQDSAADHISAAFLNSQFKSVEQRVISLSEQYGQEFLNQSIGRIENLSEEMKEGIMRGLSQKELIQIARKQSYMRRYNQRQGIVNVSSNEIYQDFNEDRSHNKKIKRYHRQQYDQENLQQSYNDRQDPQYYDQSQENSRIKDNKRLNLNRNEGQHSGQQNEERIEGSQNQGEKALKSKKKQRVSNPSKLNAAFQTTMTKTFFQEQQKTRDTLIAKQNTQLQEHQKVIDKLITFIKKQFKEKKMDDIDADDPEQLMGYYFRVNQKKYLNIQEELNEVQSKKKIIQKQKHNIIEQKMQLEEQKEILSNQNKHLQEKKTFLQIQTRQLIQEKKIVEVNLITEKQKVKEIEVECQNLRLKLELQRLQIIALSQIYQRLKVNTIEFHNMTQSTENIVKLSLQTLFNLCLNKLRPEQIIQRLEKIIQIIKVNVKLKCDVTSDLTILQFIKKEEQKAKKDFSAQVTEGLGPYIEASCTSKKQIMNQYVSFHIQKQIGDRSYQQKQTFFVDELRDIQMKLMEKELEHKPASNLPQQKKLINSTSQKNNQQINLTESHENNPFDIFNSLLLFSIEKVKQNQSQKKGQSAGIDQKFINNMIENLKLMKENNTSSDQEDINEMYQKYKQAVDCLQRSEQLNKENQMKYQNFLSDLKRKGAYQAPQVMEQKLFYMERVISQQNQLIQNQRKEYQNTILKQIEKSEQLAQSVLQSIKLSRKKTSKI